MFAGKQTYKVLARVLKQIVNEDRAERKVNDVKPKRSNR